MVNKLKLNLKILIFDLSTMFFILKQFLLHCFTTVLQNNFVYCQVAVN